MEWDGRMLSARCITYAVRITAPDPPVQHFTSASLGDEESRVIHRHIICV